MAKTDSTSYRESTLLQNSEAVFRLDSFRYHETLLSLMDKDVYSCGPDDIVHAVAEEMAKRRVSSVIITDHNKRPIGIVTERDMVRKVVADSEHSKFGRKISEIMTPDPVCLPHDGTLFDALSLISRHAIKHLPIVNKGKVIGIVTMRQIMKIRYAEPFVIIGQLEEAKSVADFKAIKDELIYLAKERLSANTDPVDIVTMISLVNAGIHKRLLRKTIEEHGSPPPVDFCFFVTGSHGRRENLLFPDQDFCIIIDDCDDTVYPGHDKYFKEIAQKFSDSLNGAGFEYCSGKIMGQNPDWRMRLSDWLSFVSGIFIKQGPYTVRYLTLIFDSARLYGSAALFNKYITHAHRELSRNHNVLRQMHDEEEAMHKVPLGLFNTFITEKIKGHKGAIDMKKSGLIFLIESARVLALKNKLTETSTLCRIQDLVEIGVIHRDDSEYFENAYRVILYHTLQAQVDNYLDHFSSDYYLAPDKLSHRSQETLKEAFKAISKLQEIVSSEFGELIL
ncbi:MAG: putative nucleotidyltransferase substrate binding domain-containing protein [Planctomycetota bacterium]